MGIYATRIYVFNVHINHFYMNLCIQHFYLFTKARNLLEQCLNLSIYDVDINIWGLGDLSDNKFSGTDFLRIPNIWCHYRYLISISNIDFWCLYFALHVLSRFQEIFQFQVFWPKRSRLTMHFMFFYNLNVHYCALLLEYQSKVWVSHPNSTARRFPAYLLLTLLLYFPCTFYISRIFYYWIFLYIFSGFLANCYRTWDKNEVQKNNGG